MAQSETIAGKSASNHKYHFSRWLKIIIGVAIFAIIVLTVIFVDMGKQVLQLREWVEKAGPWGMLVFLVFKIAFATSSIPGGIILTMASGLMFGFWWGAALSFVGDFVGSTFAFLIGRYLARDWLQSHIPDRGKLQALDKAVRMQGAKLVVLLRLANIVPFFLLNYGMGLTRITVKQYMVGGLALLPGCLIFSYSGLLVGDVARLSAENGWNQLGWGKFVIPLLAVGAILTLLITAWRMTRKALKDAHVEEELMDD
ncbi:MAG: TVP38/TMEM64 family protein [Candidatus Sumerlaeia bacterium]